VRETGIDALAVSVGNVHTLTDGTASVDLQRLTTIHQAVRVPLVIHGGTGFPEDAIADVVALGVAKFNIGSVLKQAFLEGLRFATADLPSQVAIHQVMGSRKEDDVFQSGKARMREEVVRRIRLMRPRAENNP
jgi:fructose-bisphosphate aldolase class II